MYKVIIFDNFKFCIIFVEQKQPEFCQCFDICIINLNFIHISSFLILYYNQAIPQNKSMLKPLQKETGNQSLNVQDCVEVIRI